MAGTLCPGLCLFSVVDINFYFCSVVVISIKMTFFHFQLFPPHFVSLRNSVFWNGNSQCELHSFLCSVLTFRLCLNHLCLYHSIAYYSLTKRRNVVGDGSKCLPNNFVIKNRIRNTKYISL